jgi:hypothetical protein
MNHTPSPLRTPQTLAQKLLPTNKKVCSQKIQIIPKTEKFYPHTIST